MTGRKPVAKPGQWVPFSQDALNELNIYRHYTTATRVRDRLAPHTTNRDLAHAHNDLDDALIAFTVAVSRLINSGRSPLAGTAYDREKVSGGSGIMSDDEDGHVPMTQTERLASAPDRAKAVIARLEGALARLDQHTNPLDPRSPRTSAIRGDARQVWQIVQTWKPHDPSDRESRLAAQASLDRDKGCEHHARQNIYEPVHRTGDVGGNLDMAMALCLACHNQVRRTGRLPDADWIEQRHRTGKAERERILPGR